jgi:hypothetical protein
MRAFIPSELAHSFVEICNAVTAANDELAQVGKVFLQLKLVVDRGGHRETVPMGLLTYLWIALWLFNEFIIFSIFCLLCSAQN